MGFFLLLSTLHFLVSLTRSFITLFIILKEQCHEYFAVVGQFCAKIITLRL